MLQAAAEQSRRAERRAEPAAAAQMEAAKQASLERATPTAAQALQAETEAELAKAKAESEALARVALNVKVILTPPCIFH